MKLRYYNLLFTCLLLTGCFTPSDPINPTLYDYKRLTDETYQEYVEMSWDEYAKMESIGTRSKVYQLERALNIIKDHVRTYSYFDKRNNLKNEIVTYFDHDNAIIKTIKNSIEIYSFPKDNKIYNYSLNSSFKNHFLSFENREEAFDQFIYDNAPCMFDDFYLMTIANEIDPETIFDFYSRDNFKIYKKGPSTYKYYYDDHIFQKMFVEVIKGNVVHFEIDSMKIKMKDEIKFEEVDINFDKENIN